jgi:hypothetical protein
MVKKWVKWSVSALAAIAIVSGVHYSGLEKLVTGKGSAVQAKPARKYETLVIGSNKYEVIKFGSPYYLSVPDFRKVYSELQKFNSEERKGVATIYVIRDKVVIVPVLIKKGITDNTNTAIDKVLVGELKEGDIFITGYESTSPQSKTQAQTGPSAIQGLQRIIR